MNKDVQKAFASLNEKEAKSREAIEKAAAEVKATNEKLSELKSALDKASGRDEFIKISAEIRDNEAALMFCQKKEQEARANVLTGEEYASIKAMANETLSKVRAEHRKAIIAEADKLEKLIATYDEDVATIGKLIAEASRLANNKEHISSIPTPLFDATKESATFYPHIMHAYGHYKTVSLLQQKAAIRPKKGGTK